MTEMVVLRTEKESERELKPCLLSHLTQLANNSLKYVLMFDCLLQKVTKTVGYSPR